jgi:hypothetical protein
MSIKALECASVSIGTSLLGNVKERFLPRAFEIKRYIKRNIKMPCKRVSLSIGAPLGNLDGICLLGRLERKW